MSDEATFEDRLTELERLVKRLDAGDLPLEKAVEYYRKGVAIHRELTAHLEGMERKIEELTVSGDTRPFDEGASGSSGLLFEPEEDGAS